MRDTKPGGRRRPTAEPLERRQLFTVGLTVLATLGTASDVEQSQSGVAVDAASDVFGTDVPYGNPADTGHVVEVPAGGAAAAAETVASFGADFAGDGAAGDAAVGRIVLDAKGDLFGLTAGAGAGSVTTLWELPAGRPAPVVVYRFTDPVYGGSLSADAAGDLFGEADVLGSGAVLFQVPAGGSNLRVLTRPAVLSGPVVSDPGGDLFGFESTPASGFAHGYYDDLYEVPAAAVAAATPDHPAGLVQVTPDRDAIQDPGGLTADAAGDVFATAGNELLERPAGGHAFRLLASDSTASPFSLSSDPYVDARGDVFGVGYASRAGSPDPPVALELPAGSATFVELAALPGDPADGAAADLVPDAAGNLYGDVGGAGANDPAIVFELTGQPAAVTPNSTPVPSGTSPLAPVIVAATTPTTVVSGGRARGTVTLAVTNDGPGPSTGRDTLAVFATTAGVVDASSTEIGSVTRRLSLAAGRSATVVVPVTSAAEPFGAYTVVARLTDGAGRTATSPVGLTVTAVAPSVSLSATVAAPSVASPGQVIGLTVMIANGGTVDATGPVTVTGGLSVAAGSPVVLATVTRPLRIRAHSVPVVVRLRVRVPTDQPVGQAQLAVTVGRGTVTFDAFAPALRIA